MPWSAIVKIPFSGSLTMLIIVYMQESYF